MKYIDVAYKTKQPKATYALFMSRGIVSKKFENSQELPNTDDEVRALWDENQFGDANTPMNSTPEDLDGYYHNMVRLTEDEYAKLPPNTIPMFSEEWRSNQFNAEGNLYPTPTFTYERWDEETQQMIQVTCSVPEIA